MPAILGNSVTGGIRKFVDTLPGLTVARSKNLGPVHPRCDSGHDVTVPGIGLLRNRTRGVQRDKCIQVLPPDQTAGLSADQHHRPHSKPVFHYLGPVIVAQKDRPVRIKFTNKLFPRVRRAALPASGSDRDGGRARAGQWLDGSRKAMQSAQRPDPHLQVAMRKTAQPCICMAARLRGSAMVRPISGSLRRAKRRTMPRASACQTSPTCRIRVPDRKPSTTPTSKARGLMFYHDHAFGITRLNVYAGEAAGYVITDPMEQALIDGGSAGWANVQCRNDPRPRLTRFL